MLEPTCVLNFCTRPQGIGTWVRVAVGDACKAQLMTLPVCEIHWEVLRTILPYKSENRPLSHARVKTNSF